MQSPEVNDAAHGGDAALALPLLAAADLQDHLMIAINDLERLQTLLGKACDGLLAGFHGASRAADAMQGADAGAVEPLRAHLAAAVTALQFQDMASQLIAHTKSRLHHCADRLACAAFPGDEDEGAIVVSAAPIRGNPVTQSEMEAGSVELF